jgi:hypothetical protein
VPNRCLPATRSTGYPRSVKVSSLDRVFPWPKRDRFASARDGSTPDVRIPRIRDENARHDSSDTRVVSDVSGGFSAVIYRGRKEFVRLHSIRDGREVNPRGVLEDHPVLDLVSGWDELSKFIGQLLGRAVEKQRDINHAPRSPYSTSPQS